MNSYRTWKQKDPNESKSAAEAPNAMPQEIEETPDAPDVTNQQEGTNLDGTDPINSMSMSKSNSNGDKEAEPASDPSDRIQILDLHSPNPIIAYQNQIYSCEWTSTIGTDVLLTSPGPDYPHPILREEPGVSVVATTSIKLFGRPTQIMPRESKEPTPAPDQATPVKIPINVTSRKARQNQAKFLERLIAIKAAKGEKDDVTVYAQKVNQGSARRTLPQVPPANEIANADTDPGDESVPTTPTVRRANTRGRGTSSRARGGNSRRSGLRTKKGGLFKDYRPQLFPTEGAGSSHQPSPTPSSWHQLSPSPSNDDGNIVQPNTANSFSTPPSVPPPGYRPPVSRPNIGPPNTDRMSIDTAPNVPPDPGEASRNPDADPTHLSTLPMVESGSEQRVSATEREAGGPSPLGCEAKSSVGGGVGDDDGDGGDGDVHLVGAVVRGSASDVEMGDG